MHPPGGDSDRKRRRGRGCCLQAETEIQPFALPATEKGLVSNPTRARGSDVHRECWAGEAAADGDKDVATSHV